MILGIAVYCYWGLYRCGWSAGRYICIAFVFATYWGAFSGYMLEYITIHHDTMY